MKSEEAARLIATALFREWRQLFEIFYEKICSRFYYRGTTRGDIAIFYG